MRVDLARVDEIKRKIVDLQTELTELGYYKMHCVVCGETDKPYYSLGINGSYYCLDCEKACRAK
jgi:hypothetical protein